MDKVQGSPTAEGPEFQKFLKINGYVADEWVILFSHGEINFVGVRNVEVRPTIRDVTELSQIRIRRTRIQLFNSGRMRIRMRMLKIV